MEVTDRKGVPAKPVDQEAIGMMASWRRETQCHPIQLHSILSSPLRITL